MVEDTEGEEEEEIANEEENVNEKDDESGKEKESEEEDLLGAFLDATDGNNINNTESRLIEKYLYNFRKTQRIGAKDNLITWWENKKFHMPELYQLAMIIHAMPITQVSVERLFSSMKYIFSDLRGNLSPELLDDILVIRSYFQFNRI